MPKDRQLCSASLVILPSQVSDTLHSWLKCTTSCQLSRAFLMFNELAFTLLINGPMVPCRAGTRGAERAWGPGAPFRARSAPHWQEWLQRERESVCVCVCVLLSEGAVAKICQREDSALFSLQPAGGGREPAQTKNSVQHHWGVSADCSTASLPHHVTYHMSSRSCLLSKL